MVLLFQKGEKESNMLKIEFTEKELEEIKTKIHFTPMQERIIKYRQDELSIVQMAFKEQCCESKISKEINKIKKKIMRVL